MVENRDNIYSDAIFLVRFGILLLVGILFSIYRNPMNQYTEMHDATKSCVINVKRETTKVMCSI